MWVRVQLDEKSFQLLPHSLHHMVSLQCGFDVAEVVNYQQSFSTLPSLIRFLSSVNSLVYNKLRATGETIFTLCLVMMASKDVPTVDSLMPDQICIIIKGSPTLFTLMSSHRCGFSDVRINEELPLKGFSTLSPHSVSSTVWIL